MTVTTQQVIDEARRLAAERPEFRYPTNRDGCVYVPNGDLPACIFGATLANLGISTERMGAYEGEPIETLIYNLVLGRNDDLVDRAHGDWCRTVQISQDGGTPWGEAVIMANAACPEVP